MIHSNSDPSPASEIPVKEQADWIEGEPAMPDLFDDPVIHAVLRRDGLSLADLHLAVAEGRRRLAGPPGRRVVA